MPLFAYNNNTLGSVYTTSFLFAAFIQHCVQTIRVHTDLKINGKRCGVHAGTVDGGRFHLPCDAANLHFGGGALINSVRSTVVLLFVHCY